MRAGSPGELVEERPLRDGYRVEVFEARTEGPGEDGHGMGGWVEAAVVDPQGGVVFRSVCRRSRFNLAGRIGEYEKYAEIDVLFKRLEELERDLPRFSVGGYRVNVVENAMLEGLRKKPGLLAPLGSDPASFGALLGRPVEASNGSGRAG